jgi:hypothetical protein
MQQRPEVQTGGLQWLRLKYVAIKDKTEFHTILQCEAGSKVLYLQLPVSMKLC